MRFGALRVLRDLKDWAVKSRRKAKVAITGLHCSNIGHECTSDQMLQSNREHLFDKLSSDSKELYKKLLQKPNRRRRYVVPYPEIVADFSSETKFDRYRHTATTLMTDACHGLLRTSGLTSKDFDFLIVNSMAGKTLPSLAALLSNQLGLPEGIISYNLGDMGCSAGVAAVDLAVRLLRSEQRPKRALVVSLEPVSNLFQNSDSPGAIVGNTLFGEGCAAVAVSTHNEPSLWYVQDTSRVLKADDEGLDAIKLVNGETGPLIQLSKDIPEVAGDAISTNLKKIVPRLITPLEKLRFLLTRKVPRWQRHVHHWAVHPGGIQILRGLQKNLRLADADFGPSYRVFDERSNMSSPSTFYALEHVERAAPNKGDTALMMSFGSGFKVNTLVLTKGEKKHHVQTERNAVIVGGTSGIGLASARHLAEQGYRVWVGSRRVTDAEAGRVDADGLIRLPLDVTNEASVESFAQTIWEQTFGLDVLIISSGTPGESAAVGRIEDATLADVVNVNLTGAIRTVNAMVGQVRTRGRVIFLNSILGRIPLMGNASYCAAKAGLRHFAESLDLELRRAGRHVTVHSIFPAYVDTPMLDRVKENGRTLLRPVQTEAVTASIDAILQGQRNGVNFILRRDRAIAKLYDKAPSVFKGIVSNL